MGIGAGVVGGVFALFFVVFAIVFVGVLALIITSVLRSRRVLKDAGLDPLAAEAEMVALAAHSRVLAPQRTLESRLAELDDLAARGVISADEHAAARARALESR